MTTCYIGLGSNAGDRLDNLKRAVRALRSRESIDVTMCSSVYETVPVGPAQPDFLNAVVEIRTSLGPRELLDALKAIEQQLGREPRGPRWGPREIDLDLLLYGPHRVEEPGLVVPHPRTAERAFVVVPLAEISAEAVVPGVGTADELLQVVGDTGVRLAFGVEALR